MSGRSDMRRVSNVVVSIGLNEWCALFDDRLTPWTSKEFLLTATVTVGDRPSQCIVLLLLLQFSRPVGASGVHPSSVLRPSPMHPLRHWRPGQQGNRPHWEFWGPATVLCNVSCTAFTVVLKNVLGAFMMSLTFKGRISRNEMRHWWRRSWNAPNDNFSRRSLHFYRKFVEDNWFSVWTLPDVRFLAGMWSREFIKPANCRRRRQSDAADSNSSSRSSRRRWL